MANSDSIEQVYERLALGGTTRVTPGSRQKWLQERQRGVGASDIAKIIGISPWGSPLQVWLNKTTPIDAAEATSPPAEWGKRLEGPIAQRWAEENPSAELFDPEETIFVRAAWQAATPDRLALIDDELVAIELKTVGPFGLPDWENGPPDYYICQVLWQMHVLGIKKAQIAVLSALSDFAIYKVSMSDHADAFAWILRKVTEFWEQNILGGERPDATVASDRDAATALFAQADGEVLHIGRNDPLFSDLCQIAELQQRIKTLTTGLDVVKARVQLGLGSAPSVVCEEKVLATWSSSKAPDKEDVITTLLARRDAIDEQLTAMEDPAWEPPTPSRVFRPKYSVIQKMY